MWKPDIRDLLEDDELNSILQNLSLHPTAVIRYLQIVQTTAAKNLTADIEE